MAEFITARHRKRIRRLVELAIEQGYIPTRPQAERFRQYFDAEHELSDDFLVSGMRVRGYIDLMWTHRPLIIDHKTSSDIDRWGASSQELRYDPQMMLYAAYYLIRVDIDAEEIELQHLQYARRGRVRVERVSTTVSRQHVMRQFDALARVVEEMKGVWRRTLNRVPHDETESACEMFGGCGHRPYCTALGNDEPSGGGDIWSEMEAAQDDVKPTPTLLPTPAISPPETMERRREVDEKVSAALAERLAAIGATPRPQARTVETVELRGVTVTLDGACEDVGALLAAIRPN